jgi:transcriptional regulator with XRE-family HTH domain
MNFRENVLELLERKGINQVELAERLGKSQPNVSMILKKNSPSFQTIREFAKALDVDLSEITAHRSLETDQIISRISQVISSLGISVEDFAKELDYEESDSLTLILNGTIVPGYDFFNRFAKSELLQNINISWLLTGEGPMTGNTLYDKFPEVIKNTASWDFSSLKEQSFLLSALKQMGELLPRERINKVDLEIIKNDNYTEFRHLGRDRYLIIMPLVDEFVHDDYIEHWSDNDFVNDLPKHAFSVEKLQLGTYKAFTSSDSSMNNASYQSITPYDIAVGKKIDKVQWDKVGKHSRKNQDYVVVTNEDILIRKIKPSKSEKFLHCQCLNPDKENYPDLEIDFNDINEIYIIVGISKIMN